MTRKPDYVFLVWSNGFLEQEDEPYWAAKRWATNNVRYLLDPKVAHRIRVYMKAKA